MRLVGTAGTLGSVAYLSYGLVAPSCAAGPELAAGLAAP